MSNRNIELDAPNLGVLEKEYLTKAIDSGYVSTAGPYVPEFESKFAAYLGANSFCVAVQSGTAALHMALYELGIKEGDEVIVPALTFVATVNPVVYVGATPVFVDIDCRTWNIDPQEIEKAITPKTRAIIVVHLYGNPCNMAAIMAIALKHGLMVIEDATESLGATFKGKMTGTFGQFGCFSFNGNKVITTGGGGMIATPDPKQAEHIKFLVNQGRDTSKKFTEGYYHPEIGFNYRMTNLEAALGLSQLQRLPEFLPQKRRFYEIYQTMFANSNITMQQIESDSVTSAWLSSVTINTKRIGLTIAGIQEKLKDKGIPTRRVFQPIVDFPPYRNYKLQEYLNARALYENGLNLPSSTLNSEADIEYVAQTLLEIVNRTS
jgi:perosamine synthetase